MKKLLIITTTLPRWKGDSEAPFVLNLGKELTKYYEVHILAPWTEGSKEEEVMESVYVHRFVYSKKPRLAYGAGILPNFKNSFKAKLQVIPFLISQYLAMRRIIKEFEIDVVNPWFLIPNGIQAYLSGKPYFLVSPGSDLFALCGIPPLKWAEKQILKKSFKNIVLSSAMQKKITEVFHKDSTVIPIGIYSENFKPKEKEPRQTKILLCVGRLNDQKGFQYAIKALPLILKTQDVVLKIIGEGDQEEKLKQQAKGLPVEFLGPKGNDELSKHYQEADIFIMPSQYYEGLGLVLVESLSCGTPVVGTRLGGIPDIIKHGKTGLLFKEADPEDLANKVLILLKDEDLYGDTIYKGAHHVKDNFTWESIGKKYKEVIDGSKKS